jgi:hypothetical protein
MIKFHIIDIVHDTQYLAKSSPRWGNNVISSNHYNIITISSQYHYNIIAASYSKPQVNKLVKMIMFHESAMMSQADMARDRLAGKPYPYKPCGQASPERILRLLQVARRQGRWPAAVFYPLDTPRRTPMLSNMTKPSFTGLTT